MCASVTPRFSSQLRIEGDGVRIDAILIVGFIMLAITGWQGEKTSQLKLQLELETIKCQTK